MVRFVVNLAVFLILTIGCDKSGDVETQKPLTEGDHDHYHVHGVDVEHDHAHDDFTTGGHSHPHHHE